MKRRNQRRRAVASQRFACAERAMIAASYALAVDDAAGEATAEARAKLRAAERHMWAAQKRAIPRDP